MLFASETFRLRRSFDLLGFWQDIAGHFCQSPTNFFIVKTFLCTQLSVVSLTASLASTVSKLGLFDSNSVHFLLTLDTPELGPEPSKITSVLRPFLFRGAECHRIDAYIRTKHKLLLFKPKIVISIV